MKRGLFTDGKRTVHIDEHGLINVIRWTSKVNINKVNPQPGGITWVNKTYIEVAKWEE